MCFCHTETVLADKTPQYDLAPDTKTMRRTGLKIDQA